MTATDGTRPSGRWRIKRVTQQRAGRRHIINCVYEYYCCTFTFGLENAHNTRTAEIARRRRDEPADGRTYCILRIIYYGVAYTRPAQICWGRAHKYGCCKTRAAPPSERLSLTSANVVVGFVQYEYIVIVDRICCYRFDRGDLVYNGFRAVFGGNLRASNNTADTENTRAFKTKYAPCLSAKPPKREAISTRTLVRTCAIPAPNFPSRRSDFLVIPTEDKSWARHCSFFTSNILHAVFVSSISRTNYSTEVGIRVWKKKKKTFANH